MERYTLRGDSNVFDPYTRRGDVHAVDTRRGDVPCVGAQGIQDSIVAIGAESREGSRDSLGTKYEPPGDKPGERKQATKDLGTKDE